MLERFIAYFVNRHLLTNMVFISVLVGGILSWPEIKKEELPDVTFDRVRISATYPGATAGEVEHFVTKEIEKAIAGLDGIYRVTSTTSQESARLTVELAQGVANKDEVITDIRNAVSGVELPDEIRKDPTVRVFKTSRKAILDVALIHTDVHLLGTKDRQLIQRYALALENQILNLPQVNSINRSGYFQPELQIKIDPKKLIRYAIPISQVKNEIKQNHARQPAGHIKTKNEPKITIDAQLDTPEKLNALYIQAGFEGQAITLKEIADVSHGFNLEKEIIKVNGHGAIMLNVVKNSTHGIVESVKAVEKVVEQFKANYLKNTPINVVLLDDESIDVRNRLSIIAINGSIGFTLIILILFIFLNPRSGLWFP